MKKIIILFVCTILVGCVQIDEKKEDNISKITDGEQNISPANIVVEDIDDISELEFH